MNLDWTYFFSLFSVGAFWRACFIVMLLSSLSWVMSLGLGFLVACAKMSKSRWLSLPASFYIWFFRSVPLLVLLVFVYNLPQLFPSTGFLLGMPFIAGLVSLVSTGAAYMAEIHRGGLLAVAKGQHEAGHALNLGVIGIQRNIVIPQAFRISLPAMINEFANIIKLSSLVSVISLQEILATGQRLYTQNFLVLETLLAVAIYYVLIVTIFSSMLQWVERRIDIPSRKPMALSDDECATLRSTLSAPPLRNLKTDRGDPPALQLRNIRKAYDKHVVLKDVSIDVGISEVISIIGPSGSGKTTLIRTINKLESLDNGEIILFGEDFIKASNASSNNKQIKD